MVIKKVQTAKKKVMVILPVRLPPPGGEWYDTHDVSHEDKEEARQKIRCIPIGLLTYVGLITSS